MIDENQIQKLLSQLTPDQQNFAKAVSTMRLENKTLRESMKSLKAQHDDFYRLFVTILDSLPEKEFRIHRSQFLRFVPEYRIERKVDEVTDEVVYKLMTLKDELK